jgi:hypothetical protein
MSAELERVVRSGDVDGTVRWLVEASPAERKAARERMLQLREAGSLGDFFSRARQAVTLDVYADAAFTRRVAQLPVTAHALVDGRRLPLRGA